MLDGWLVVTSVLAPGSGIQSGNGAKQIDVIARYVSERHQEGILTSKSLQDCFPGDVWSSQHNILVLLLNKSQHGHRTR